MSMLLAPGLTGKAKLDDVTTLLSTLKVDLEDGGLSPDEREAALQKLKVHGRSVQDAGPIFTPEGIETLVRQGLERTPSKSSREALRCLANALFLVPATRQTFVDLDFGGRATERLSASESGDRDDEFLLSRILFLATYGTSMDFDSLVDRFGLAKRINENISSHVERYDGKAAAAQTSPMDEMALSESLKLLFNITHYFPGRVTAFDGSIVPILDILKRRAIGSKPLEQPVNFLINALINLDLQTAADSDSGRSSILFPPGHETSNTERIITLLDRATTSYAEAELDQQAAPLVTLIRKVHELAPDYVRRTLQAVLLPAEEERSQPLGKSDSLPSRLLRLSTAAMAPALRENVSALLFELSGKDARTYIANVGYGFASGFLMSHEIAIPKDALDASDAGSSRAEVEAATPVNPITGQKLSAEAVADLPNMTDAEKEHEAEKLFVLFERLKKTGVIDVKNPVEQAIDDGRFEELED
ncbi:MAG: hypothetical protein M1832_004188 [Thelocarpon impressellum]|nr:MAG: hypothetical protein M1832_004188 [Thelocarpon impressellum]